jgi:hypothetical protein
MAVYLWSNKLSQIACMKKEGARFSETPEQAYYNSV